MGTMTTTTDEQQPRRFARNATDQALEVHPSARPVPDRVAPGELVEVDEWALESLAGSGFEHVGIKSAKDEHAKQLAKLAAAVEQRLEDPTDDQPAAPADGATDATDGDPAAAHTEETQA